MTREPAVHSKSYVWIRDGQPIRAFVGSANYTQASFLGLRREALSEDDPVEVEDYYNRLLDESVYCNHNDAENLVAVVNDRAFNRQRRLIDHYADGDTILERRPELMGLESVTISLLNRSGELPGRSGLNWGQRPELHREPNQAYIRVPANIARSDFFPPRAQHFTVLTDDGFVLICSIAQQNRKAIHTPHNNSHIGEYFRRRLSVPMGHPVHLDNLVRYGRTDMSFYKIDDETYYLDFSVTNNG